MINITTSPDIRLYINDTIKWVTVAKGFDRTLSFNSTLPPIVTQPIDFFINAANIITSNTTATATSTTSPFIENQLYDYEVVESNVSLVQEDCSYNMLITDTSIINNPYISDRGVIDVEIYDEATNEFVPLTTIRRLGSTTIKHCSAGIYTIRTRYTVRLIPNCGGVSPIILQTEWRNTQYTVLEYVPLLSLPTSNCCYTINEPITITPLSIVLNNNSCPIPVVFNNEIKYQLYSYNSTTRLYDLVTETTLTVVSPVLTTYNFVFTPTKLTHYKLIATLSNCCVKVVKEEIYNLCEAVRISNTNCNVYKFENVSLVDTYTYEIKNVITNAVFGTVTLLPLANTTVTLTDGIYTFTFTNKTNNNVFIKVVYVYCIIENCYIKSIKDLLCTIRNCKDCKSVEDIKKMSELNEFRSLYQVWMKSIEVDYRLKVSYAVVDVNSKSTEFQDNDKIYKTLLQYCEPCNKQIEDCGCN